MRPNTGSGVIDAGSVGNPSALTGHSYAISFTVSGSATTYQVQDTTTNATVASGNYTAPATLSFDGQQVTVSGAPASGDTFTSPLRRTSRSSPPWPTRSLRCKQPAQAPAANAQLQTALGSALSSASQALDHMTLKQTQIGNQLQQLNSYSALNADRTLQANSALSTIRDLDYAKAATQLTQQQTVFQAALQSYSAVSKLSLFNYL